MQRAKMIGHSAGSVPLQETAVEMPVDGKVLSGDLVLPGEARGLILFAHGRGSSRHSPRNRYVARVLHTARLATLLLDLLTSEEESVDIYTRHHRFNITLLAARLLGASHWVRGSAELSDLPLGYFGASTGAAAALVAATDITARVEAVVSRGGRPDLAGPALPQVTAPTLLIVGGLDQQVIELNKKAQRHLRCENRLLIVPGASHLFEEPGALEGAARMAREWFCRFCQGGNVKSEGRR